MTGLRILAALALACVTLITTTGAEARQRTKAVAAHASCIPTSDVMRPCAYQPNFLAGIRSIRVTMKREGNQRKANKYGHKSRGLASKEITHRDTVRPTRANNAQVASYGAPSPSIGYSIARPLRYIAGRLVCALNVGAALAERGIKGTGSALAKSYDHWGHASAPVPGAVAVSDRKGGGHVAIVSRVEGGRVFVWNATGGRRGWHEVEYTNRHARYRVAGY